MKTVKALLTGTAMMIAAALTTTPATAQESSYKLGPVWEVSRIDVLPGQSENYMDYLATTWKKVQEAGKAEGIVVDYHVLQVNNPRAGEPDLMLVIVYKDYMTNAQQEAFQKKVNAMLSQDRRQAAAAGAARMKMREPMGSIEMQELVLN